MEEGTVKFFNDQKGFGFIIVDGSNEEVFVHKTALRQDVRENDRVQFNVQEGDRGKSAVDVSKID